MDVPPFLLPLTPLRSKGLAGPSAESSSRELDSFAVEIQTQRYWCWAAVSVSVATFYGAHSWTQCKLATAELALDCCVSPAPCNRDYRLNDALTRVGHFGELLWSPLAFLNVKSEIEADRPIGCRIQWAPNGRAAHFVVLGGWLVASDGSQYVTVHDPARGRTQLLYLTFVSGYNQVPEAQWTHSYIIKGQAALGGTPHSEAPNVSLISSFKEKRP